MDSRQQSKPALSSPYGLDRAFGFLTGIFSSSADNSSQPSSTNGRSGAQRGSPPRRVQNPASCEFPAPLGEMPNAHTESTNSARQPRSNEIGEQEEQPQQQQQRPHGFNDRRGQPYEVCQDDLLDQHVAYYLRHHPEIHSQHSIHRLRAGVYALDRREVHMEWQHVENTSRQGFLVIVDGPLRQPFADYMEMTEKNAEYDFKSCHVGSLHSIPKEQRMSFHDNDKVYTRLEAMKVAAEQAAFREKHADYVKEGTEVPDDLMMKYKKTVQQKLGQQTPQRSAYVMTPPPDHSSDERGFRSYTPQKVFTSEPMDYFDDGSSMWGTAWAMMGPSQTATRHSYGEGDRRAPLPPPSSQQASSNRNTAWSETSL